MKIAIIEDDIAISQMYRSKFEIEGFKVETAENGQIGLKMVEKFKPNIILLDLMMPIMGGEEMLTAMRANSWGKKIPVIILTNLGKEEAPETLAKLGVDTYIVKADMTPKQVAETVTKKLKKS